MKLPGRTMARLLSALELDISMNVIEGDYDADFREFGEHVRDQLRALVTVAEETPNTELELSLDLFQVEKPTPKPKRKKG